MAKKQDINTTQQAVLEAFEKNLRAQMEKQADKISDTMLKLLEQQKISLT